MTNEQKIQDLQQQIVYLTFLVHTLYNRLQLAMPPMPTGQQAPGMQRTETGMGPIISPDKTSFL